MGLDFGKLAINAQKLKSILLLEQCQDTVTIYVASQVCFYRWLSANPVKP